MVGICFSPRLLNHGVGNWYEPLVTRGGITFPFTRGKPLVKGKVPCLRLILNGLGQFLLTTLCFNLILISLLFVSVKQDIESSRVFQTIRRLPKGGILHIHDFGMTSVEWVIQNVTYRDNLYMCIDSATDSLKFGWFSNPPQLDAECLWMNVKDTRTLLGNYKNS